MTQPKLAQPLFATEDYGLIHDAIAHVLDTAPISDGARHAKLARLRYRLSNMLPQDMITPPANENCRNPLVWE